MKTIQIKIFFCFYRASSDMGHIENGYLCGVLTNFQIVWKSTWSFSFSFWWCSCSSPVAERFLAKYSTELGQWRSMWNTLGRNYMQGFEGNCIVSFLNPNSDLLHHDKLFMFLWMSYYASSLKSSSFSSQGFINHGPQREAKWWYWGPDWVDILVSSFLLLPGSENVNSRNKFETFQVVIELEY